jgi:hypothetical protein
VFHINNKTQILTQKPVHLGLVFEDEINLEEGDIINLLKWTYVCGIYYVTIYNSNGFEKNLQQQLIDKLENELRTFLSTNEDTKEKYSTDKFVTIIESPMEHLLKSKKNSPLNTIQLNNSDNQSCLMPNHNTVNHSSYRYYQLNNDINEKNNIVEAAPEFSSTSIFSTSSHSPSRSPLPSPSPPYKLCFTSLIDGKERILESVRKVATLSKYNMIATNEISGFDFMNNILNRMSL